MMDKAILPILGITSIFVFGIVAVVIVPSVHAAYSPSVGYPYPHTYLGQILGQITGLHLINPGPGYQQGYQPQSQPQSKPQLPQSVQTDLPQQPQSQPQQPQSQPQQPQSNTQSSTADTTKDNNNVLIQIQHSANGQNGQNANGANGADANGASCISTSGCSAGNGGIGDHGR